MAVNAALLGAVCSLGACTDIERCEVGTEGCVCAANGSCTAGLLCIGGYCESQSQEICKNDCGSARDGVCDDGGEDSETSLCSWGRDCADCEPRSGSPSERRLCTDTCVDAADTTCDDGGEDSVFGRCDLGTDCTDCGPRMVSGDGRKHCEDTCENAGDGTCDDGGPDSTYSSCDWGTDCTDCGERYGDPQ